LTIKLGLFDSGVGGFSVLKRVKERFGNIPCVYLGDVARVPYGTKSPEEIRTIAIEITNWLNNQNLSAVLIACNTTNSLALDILEKNIKVPTFGLIESGAQMILEERIGVLATSATVASMSYTKKILSLNPGCFVLEQACPAFVPMIEMGQLNTDEIRKVAIDYLKPLLDYEVQAVILGCSHYPLLSPLIKELLPKQVRLIDPALGLVRSLEQVLKNSNYSSSDKGSVSNTRFCVTADPSGFATRAMYWLNNYPEVELVSLRSKACVF
tara:strand:+ start:327 stop:1130 length:804 start_codon:yes stop_codon:yes gene_type:complete